MGNSNTKKREETTFTYRKILVFIPSFKEKEREKKRKTRGAFELCENLPVNKYAKVLHCSLDFEGSKGTKNITRCVYESGK